MTKPEVLLRKLVKFREGLIAYNNLLRDYEMYQTQADSLRAELSIQLGELRDDIEELQIPTQWHGGGRTFPTFETALSIPGYSRPVNLESLGFAVQSLELGIGILRKRIQNPQPERRAIPIRWWVVSLVAVALVLAWLGGRNEMNVRTALAEFTAGATRLLEQLGVAFTLKVLVLSIVGMFAAIFLGLFVNQVHTHGWKGRKQMVYFILTIVFSLLVALIAKLA
jgi:hypothetical protein